MFRLQDRIRSGWSAGTVPHGLISAAAPVPVKRSRPKRIEAAEKFMFSGHQSFALRIAWLPKSVALLSRGVDRVPSVKLRNFS